MRLYTDYSQKRSWAERKHQMALVQAWAEKGESVDYAARRCNNSSLLDVGLLYAPWFKTQRGLGLLVLTDLNLGQ